jgi:hypothetical protein
MTLRRRKKNIYLFYSLTHTTRSKHNNFEFAHFSQAIWVLMIFEQMMKSILNYLNVSNWIFFLLLFFFIFNKLCVSTSFSMTSEEKWYIWIDPAFLHSLFLFYKWNLLVSLWIYRLIGISDWFLLSLVLLILSRFVDCWIVVLYNCEEKEK